MPDPEILLAWMAARGSVEISIRDIGEAAPRAFRRKAAFEPALEALLRSGAIVETSARPRMFRVAARVAELPSADGIRALLAGELAERRSAVSDDAAAYIAVADVRTALIEQLRQFRGLPCPCSICEAFGREIDDAVMAALGCDAA